jgi:outer membrane protein TolC
MSKLHKQPSYRRAFAAVTICLLLAFPGATPAAGQTALPETLTLSQAIATALRMNPLTRVTAASREMAAAQWRESRAGRLPLFQVTETFTRSNNPVFVFGTLLEQGRFGPANFAIDSLNHPNAINNFRSAVSLRLPLFDQRQTETRSAQSKIAIEHASYQTESTEQQIRFEVVRSYYALLLADARLAVAEDAVKTGEADVKSARDMVETGVVVESDLLAAEVQLSEFRQQRIQAHGELVIARAALNTALGLPVDTPNQLADKLEDRDFQIDPVSMLSEQALTNRPDYQRVLLSSRSSEIQLRGARGEWLPRVDAFATAGASTPHLTGGSGDYAAGASVTFNVFDAGRKARIDQAKAAESAALAERDQVANQIRFEVVRSYEQYLTARARLAVVSQISTQASETLRIVQDRYAAGLTTITELLRAETALVRARSDVLGARFDQYVGYANVLLTTGRLKDVGPFSS